MPFFILHRSPELWEEPDRFKPERWLTAGCDHLDGKSGQPLRYCPFSQGPRNCAGQSMADMNVRAILAALWGRFTFKPVGDVSGGKGGGAPCARTVGALPVRAAPSFQCPNTINRAFHSSHPHPLRRRTCR